MSSDPEIDPSVRTRILERPETVLDDRDVMKALIDANNRAMGTNIVDLRAIAMERLEHRLGRLEDTHRSVIAAAYENLAGTNQVHRAILRMLDPLDFPTFINDLSGDVAQILQVDCIRLVIESPDADGTVPALGETFRVVDPGFVDHYITLGRNVPARPVTLRQVQPNTTEVYGEKSSYVRSEACLRLDFGGGRLPGLLILGAEDPHTFSPQQGTDLLSFFAGVFERTMRRWLNQA